MSRFDLRDVSERLTKSRTVESVISEFLRSLEAMRREWRASLAFYEVSQDALLDVYEIDQGRLVRRNIVVPVERLPHRLVRKIFQSTGPIQHQEREFLSQPGSSPHYIADSRDASDLMPLTVLAQWESCVCMPLGYQDDLIAMLVLVSPKKNAFGGKTLGEVMPLKSIATVALAQNLYRSARHRGVPPSPPPPDEGETKLVHEAETLAQHSSQLDHESKERSAQIEALLGQIETLDRSSSTYKDELEQVKLTVSAIEKDSENAIEFLTEAYQQLQTTQWTLEDLQKTMAILKDVFRVLAEEHAVEFFHEVVVEWFCGQLEIGRCSLLVPDASGQTLALAAHRGIDPAIAGKIRVRIGQGVAGWVAAHRKPLFVRARDDAQSLSRSPDGTYNSDSFIVVPMVHNGRLHGVLNLSNRLDTEGFSEADLDRAVLAASAFAVTFGGQQLARQSAAWA
jgi:transcriptional regulator with GAF, ATPase, and Fis domain